MALPPDTKLEDVIEWLRRHVDDGVACPACTQFAKVYRRKINSGMARSLIAMFTVGGPTGTDWVHLPTQIGARSREEGKLAYWGLVEESPDAREDGGRAGWWRVTPKGRLFVLDGLKVPSHARVYNGRVLNLTGTSVSIRDALGTKFSLEELMKT